LFTNNGVSFPGEVNDSNFNNTESDLARHQPYMNNIQHLYMLYISVC